MYKTAPLKFIFIFLMSLLFSKKLFSQRYISSETIQMVQPTPTASPSCINESNAYKKKYSQQSFYIPKKNDPVITLKITIHIFKPISDSGRWQMDNNKLNGTAALSSMMDSITNGHQERYSAKRSATYAKDFNSPHIRDSKIKYEITNVYFYPEPNLYALYNDQALFEYIEKIDPKRIEEGMPLVINGSNGPGHLSSYKGAAAIVTTIGNGDPIFARSHLLHEIGHAFGLGHTYVNTSGGGSDWQNFGGACGSDDYLSDVFPNNNPACQNEGQATFKPTNAPCMSCFESSPDTSNNLMGGQRYNLWMSPLQMGRRIRSVHLNANAGRNLRQFVKDMESDHKNVWTISKSEGWDFDIQLYKDIVVKAGATLTVKCKVAMAIDGKIKLESGAKLIVDGGEITSWCKSGSWEGVQTPAIKKKKKGDKKVAPVYITVINGGAINKAKMQMPITTTK
ncbi:MAG: hypothetical protein Q8L81_00800 [Bacteroidota bacterium]|nr:hypothetical protein [Bacteroidota bacterium]